MSDFCIVTVNFNNLSGLKRTLASIDRQSSKPDQWIVIDGASSDGSAEWANCQNTATTVVSEADEGIYDAMSKGLALCDSEFVLFLHSGDTLTDGAVEAIRSTLNDESDVFYFSCFLGTPDGRGQRLRPARSESYLWHSVPANQQATVYRSKAVRKYGLGDHLQVSGDYWLAAQLFHSGHGSVSNNLVISRFELGGTSTVRPLRALHEANTVQRDILNEPRRTRLLSAVRRASTLAVVHLALRFPRLLNVVRSRQQGGKRDLRGVSPDRGLCL